VIDLEWKLIAKYVVCLSQGSNAEVPTVREGGQGRRGEGRAEREGWQRWGGKNSDSGDSGSDDDRRLPSEDEDGGSGNGASERSVVTPVVVIAVVVAIVMSVVTPAV
jgi:hypothetical protein